MLSSVYNLVLILLSLSLSLSIYIYIYIYIYIKKLYFIIPGIQLDKGGYPELEQAIKKNVEDAKLIHHPPWALKLIQVINI